MNFTSLEYFIAVAREGSMTRAAEMLHISQQAMSSHIRKLEEEAGVKLFERTAPLSLTYAGKQFLKGARSLLTNHRQLMQQMVDIRNETRGTLLIGINHSRGAALLPLILPSFSRKNPDIEVKLIEGYSTSLEEAMLNDETDINIGYHPKFVEQIKSHIIDVVEDRIVMLASQRCMERLFGDRAESVRARMRAKPEISLFRDAPFVMLNRKMTIRKQVDEFLLKNGFVPKIVLETASLETQLALAMEDFGICFHSQTMLEGLNEAYQSDIRKNMDIFCIDDPSLQAHLCVYFRCDRYLSRSAWAFIDEMLLFYNNPTRVNWSELDALQN